jgi:hypothetical protein
MSVSFNKFRPFVENLAEKVFNLGSDTLKLALTNTVPTNTMNQYSELTPITAENGYASGGPTASITSSAQTTGTYKLVLVDVVVTASGGTIGALRYVVLYDDTATNDELIGWWDYASSITLQDGDTFTVDFDASAGVLTIA